MKLLNIETSTRAFGLAVSDGVKVIKSRKVIIKKVLSSSIIPSIDKILKESKLKLKDIDVFVIGLGPGSFTSLRVGLSTVKGLAFALEKPIIGIPSMDVIARGLLKNIEPGTQICVVSDAKRNLVYGAIYENAGGELKRKSEYLLTPLEDLLGRIDGDTVFTGDAISLYQKKITDFFKTGKKDIKVSFAAEKFWYPQAKYLAVLAEGPLRRKRFNDLDKIVPLYLYPENCQVQR